MHTHACTLQVVPAELLYAPSSDAQNFTQTYPMDYAYNEYNEPLRRRFRAAAHAVPRCTASLHCLAALPRCTASPHCLAALPRCTASLLASSLLAFCSLCPLLRPEQVIGEGAALVRPAMRRRAHAEWRRWRRASSHILGVHVRGTDKTVAPRVSQRG